MDFDDVADELYSLPPERFVATRTDREKEAKAAGDRQLAARIRRLGKPSHAAWLANQLVRSHRDEIGPLLELGNALRAATAALDGAQLRELDRQQHRLVYALVQQAKRLAAAAGRSVSDDVERALDDTLHAALADEGAAERLSTARLTESLDRGAGFPPAGAARPLRLVPSEPPPARESAVRVAAGRTQDRDAEDQRAARDEAAVRAAAREAERQRRAAELEQAEREETRAQAAARAATDERDRAQRTADRAAEALHEAAAAVGRLEAELTAAIGERSTRTDEERAARADLENAGNTMMDATRQVTAATERRRTLAAEWTSSPKP